MREMNIESRVEDGAAVITVEGSIDAQTAPRFEEHLNQQIAAGQRRLVIDLAKVVFMSSAGLRVLITIHRKIGEAGIIALAAPQPNIRTVIEMVGIDRIAKIHDTLAEALESVAA